ncbi:aaa family protein [Apiospora hydei]|uniref:Aaa family protein n=1 Tax=Apiospora hydei TaxID=1337664 RepID=A0ABR1UUS6_9PEZI
MPLYTVSAGQLGTEASRVEENLKEALQLSKGWGAVLLLVEADVFLEQRDSRDLHRNHLVSVFLRALEYFEGVLFLTTNRLQDFDTAFESRIDIHLEFPDLDADSRLRIWKNLLSNLKRPVDFTEADYEKLAAADINGRRIKNIIKSATLLMAVDADTQKQGVENGSLSMKHIETMLQIPTPTPAAGGDRWRSYLRRPSHWQKSTASR